MNEPSKPGSGSGCRIAGWGAVSPAGWSAPCLSEAVKAGQPLPVTVACRDGGLERRFRKVPPMPAMPDWMKFARMRRTTVVARHALHAAVEALGLERLAQVQGGGLKVGVVFCTMNGCVQFSRKFYAEVLQEPALASPIFFPETVYNAPASHLSTLLGSVELNYTLVGDSSQFVSGVELATQWIEDGLVEGCLVVAAEEQDWLSDEALRLFGKEAVAAEGAAAVYVTAAGGEGKGINITHFTRAWSYSNRLGMREAAQRVHGELTSGQRTEGDVLLCDGLGGMSAQVEMAEAEAWKHWPGARMSLRKVIGEGFGVTSGWQMVLACEALQGGGIAEVWVSAVGLSQQAVGLGVGS